MRNKHPQCQWKHLPISCKMGECTVCPTYFVKQPTSSSHTSISVHCQDIWNVAVKSHESQYTINNTEHSEKTPDPLPWWQGIRCGKAGLRQSNILGSLLQGYRNGEGGKNFFFFFVIKIETTNIYSELFIITYHCMVCLTTVFQAGTFSHCSANGPDF